MKKSRLPLLATLTYLLIGTGWILMGFFLTSQFDERSAAPVFELYKGLAFVAITALLLFAVLRRMNIQVPEETGFHELAGEFRQSIRIGERTERWLPPGLAVLIIMLLCMLLLGLYWVRDHTLKIGEQSADALRHAVAAQVGSSLKAVDVTLSQIAHDLATGNDADTVPELRLRLSGLTTVVRTLSVVDAQGRLTLNTDNRPPGTDLSGRDYFQHHHDNPKSGFFISSPLKSVFTGNWIITATRPVRGPRGEFLGVVAAILDLERFGRYWQMPILGEQYSIALFREDGTLLMRSPHSDDVIGKSYSNVTAWRELVPKQRNVVYRNRSSIDGIKRIFAYGRVDGYPELLLFAGIPEQHFLLPWQRFSAVSIGTFMMFIALVLVLSFILLRQLRARIESQKKSAELARYPLQNRNPVLTVSPSGARLFMNDAARQLILSVRGSADAQQLDRAIQDMAMERTRGNREFIVGNRTFSASFMPHPPDYCDIYLTDFTVLRQGENLLRLFFDLPFIGMAESDPDTRRWLRCNDRLCDILGHSRSQLLQKTWDGMTHPDDVAADLAQFERAKRGEIDGYTMDKRFIRADGSTVHVAMDIRAVRRPDGSIERFVCTVQDITGRKQQEQNLRQQRDLYAALSATNEAIVRFRERDAIFARICEAAVDKAGFAFAWVGLVDPADRSIRPVARHGDDRGYIDNLQLSADPSRPEGHGTTALAISQGSHQIVNDIAGSEQMVPWHALAAYADARALGTFPIRQGGSVIGVLKLYAREQDYFDADIVKLLDEMVDDVSYALDNLENDRQRALAVAELQASEARWQFALEGGEHGVWEWNIQTNTVYFSPQWKAMLGYADAEIGDALNEWQSRVHPDDLQPTLQTIERHLRDETPVYISEHRLRCRDGSYKWILDRGKVMSRSEDGKPLLVIGTHTDITTRREAESRLIESEAKFKGLVEQSLVGIFIIDDTTLFYANPRTAEILGYHPDEILGPKLEKMVHQEDWPEVLRRIRMLLSGESADLRHEFRALRSDGTIVHIGAHGSRARYAERPVVIGVLQDITHRLETERQLTDYVARLERSITATVEAISQMVDLRDPYTAGHERRVGDLAATIGGELGMSAHETMGLRIIGGLHDVGKITVPVEILSKPGRLSVPEFEIIKSHPEKGHEILRNIDFPWPVAQVVLQHHERMDGSGYPRGLKGGDIIREARILAVADVVESMASHRPYRPALGLDKALAEIERGAGTLYDPDAVAACLQLFRNKGYLLPE